MRSKILEVLKYYQFGRVYGTTPATNRLLHYFAKQKVLKEGIGRWVEVNGIKMEMSTAISAIMQDEDGQFYNKGFYPKWLNEELKKSVKGKENE